MQEKLERSSDNKGYELKILIQTKEELATDRLFELISDVQIVKSPKLLADELRTQITVPQMQCTSFD